MRTYGMFARHVRDLEMPNIRADFEKQDLRPAMVCIDVKGLEIVGFKAQLADGVPAARFEEVIGLVIRNSPVLPSQAAEEEKAVVPKKSVETSRTYRHIGKRVWGTAEFVAALVTVRLAASESDFKIIGLFHDSVKREFFPFVG